MANPSIIAALSLVSLNGVQPLGSQSRDAVIDLLEQAHGIVGLMQASFNDAADLRNANKNSEFASLNERLPQAALGAVSTLISLASALGQEG